MAREEKSQRKQDRTGVGIPLILNAGPRPA